MTQHLLGNIDRRDSLKAILASLSGAAFATSSPAEDLKPSKKKAIAAVVTIYQPNSHADVLLTKILEGWKHDSGSGPQLELASLYVDQFPERDMARAMAKKHGVPIFDSIEQAVTVGGKNIPVEGVLSIGEHGNYPWNERGQHLYPRRRFFKEITDTFQKYNRVVPVFNDKHLGPVWEDAKWMADRARKMKIPFMAGSSLPVSFRDPDLTIPMGCELESAVGVGYSGLDIYGFHTLDCYQAFVERRAGGETGVKSVRCLEGKSLWQAVDDGVVSNETLTAALAVAPGLTLADVRQDQKAALFLFEYVDGFQGAVLMSSKARRISLAVKLNNNAKPQGTRFEERPEPRYPHFAYLLKAFEQMVHTGKPTYPVERTILSGGILDRALVSRSLQGKKLLTPELNITYKPVDYPHAPNPKLNATVGG